MKNAAGMFASVLNQQATKTVPKIDEVIQKIQNSLGDIQLISKLGVRRKGILTMR